LGYSVRTVKFICLFVPFQFHYYLVHLALLALTPLKLSCDSRFQRAFTACSWVFKVPWFDPSNVISLKTQPHAVNPCVKRSSQRSLNYYLNPYKIFMHGVYFSTRISLYFSYFFNNMTMSSFSSPQSLYFLIAELGHSSELMSILVKR